MCFMVQKLCVPSQVRVSCLRGSPRFSAVDSSPRDHQDGPITARTTVKFGPVVSGRTLSSASLPRALKQLKLIYCFRPKLANTRLDKTRHAAS